VQSVLRRVLPPLLPRSGNFLTPTTFHHVTPQAHIQKA
jgi:hypothetical protein